MPIDADVSSLSAILLDSGYYEFLQKGKTTSQRLPTVGAVHLMPLKARAWLDMTERKAKGDKIASDTIKNGTVLVFLLAGPATNLASVGLIRRELGTRATVAYLAGIAVTSVGLGLAVDALLPGTTLDPVSQIDGGGELVPPIISFTAAVLIGLLALKPVRSIIGRFAVTGR